MKISDTFYERNIIERLVDRLKNFIKHLKHSEDEEPLKVIKNANTAYGYKVVRVVKVSSKG